MDYVIMAGQLMLSLSILIILHELGHFIPAKWFGTRVEKFYLFFDPWFSLLNIKKGETEYGIGWLPLGGYVKISGMIDESFDSEQMKGEPQDWEFRSKPAWQRLVIMLGGVTVNFLLGFFIFGMILWAYGEEYLPAENAKYGIYADSLGQEMGLQTGDFVLSVNDKPFDKFSDRTILREVIFNDAEQMKVRRDGQETTIPIDPKWIGILSSYKNKEKRLFTARYPFVAGLIVKDLPAERAGMEVGDSIIAINGEPVPFFDNFMEKAKSMPGQDATITVIRDQNQTLDLDLTLTETGQIGVLAYSADYFFDLAREDYTLAQALPAGVQRGYQFLADQMKAFGQIFKGKVKPSDSLGGFGSIGKMFGAEWQWEHFWRMTAILSLILAFMNLLPIPALDGGHVMFLLYEVVSGRKPSDKFMEYATLVGFIIVIALVLYANGLDVLRGIFG